MGKTLFSTAVGLVLLAFTLVPATAFSVGTVCTDNSQCNAGEYCQISSKQVKGSRSGICSDGSASSSNSGTGVDTLACQSRANTLLKACQTSQTDAAYWCDSNNNEGMGSVMNTASQLGVLAGSAAASSVTASCSSMAGLAQAANAATAAFKLSCAGYISSCSTACDAVESYLKRNNYCRNGSITPDVTASTLAATENMAEESGKACSKMNANVAAAQQSIVNLAQTAMNASQCANESAATDSLAELCKTNPAFVGCAALTSVDCTSATMASNRVCVCAANPMDPTCNLNTANTNANAVAGNGGFDQSSTGTNGDGLGLTGGDLPGLPEIAQGALNKGGNDQAIDGKQGNGTGFGSSGGKGGLAGGGKNGAGGAEGKDTQVTAGFYGGGGGGGGWGSGGAGRGGVGGRYGEEGMPGAKPGNPDLRQFLPGGKYDPKFRGLAGMSGPDGITGPNSSIWKKIQNRYQVMSPSLLP